MINKDVSHTPRRFAGILLVAFIVPLLNGCQALGDFQRGGIGKDVASYEAEGRKWGAKHGSLGLKPGSPVDQTFVQALIDREYLDFFWVHADLKDAFKKGYRLGYQDRTADLVLGPHLTESAARIGNKMSSRFVNVVETFERDWAETLRLAVNVFITLISEGSQADRERFISEFSRIYDQKYQRTQRALREGGFVTQVSEGGTTLYIDARKTVAVLNIPSTRTLKTEVYHQTFKVMGDEWGRRHSHNLIKRDELVDVLRRSRTAFLEVPPGLAGNLSMVKQAFIASYGSDAENVFRQLSRDAGYN